MAEIMAKKKIRKGVAEGAKKLILNVKLRVPSGISLNDGEAKYVIDGWKSEQKSIASKRNDLIEVSNKIERRQKKLPDEISDASKQLCQAKTNYKNTKDPVLKRKWARRMIVSGRYHSYLRNSSQSLQATVERVRDAVEDSGIVHNMIKSRIEDAEIYRELNGGLRLVGKALIEARTQHIMPEIEYQNLEFTMEALEKELSGSDDSLLIEAETIVGNKVSNGTDPKTKG